MSKVICDICGTTYQDTADACPICGYSRSVGAGFASDDFLLEDMLDQTDAARGKGGAYSAKKKKEIFDFDEVNPEEFDPEDDDDSDYDEDDDDYDEYEEPPRHNTFLVIFLVILIVVLLLATGFIFFRFFMPNLIGEETVPTTEPVITQAPTTETTEPKIPCTSLVLTSGNAEITQPGFYFLLNVIVMPEDTTDELVYTSADETVATVSPDGRITAVGEGETVIYITCGSQQVSCPVVCSFAQETTAPTEETTAETLEATEATTAQPDVVLKLVQEDIMLMVPYSCQLELDCELALEDVDRICAIVLGK